MVKGVARSAGPSSTPQQLPAMQAGQNPSDPLTQLNTHRGFGAMAGLNPFAEMGLNPNDPNMVSTPHKVVCPSIPVHNKLHSQDANHAQQPTISPTNVTYDVRPGDRRAAYRNGPPDASIRTTNAPDVPKPTVPRNDVRCSQTLPYTPHTSPAF